eukprot:COSAG01_NODE_5589_length_4160_cov_2.299926_5_plen_91_part_00
MALSAISCCKPPLHWLRKTCCGHLPAPRSARDSGPVPHNFPLLLTTYKGLRRRSSAVKLTVCTNALRPRPSPLRKPQHAATTQRHRSGYG